MTKILMTTDTVGGVWTYALELAGALADGDTTIVLATMGAPLRDTQRAEAAALRHVVVHERTYALEWMSNPWHDVARAGEWLLELERAEQPDLVHLNGYVHGALPWHAPRIVVGHSCVQSWWSAVRGEPAPPAWDEYTARVRAGLCAADAVVTPSRAMADALRTHYGPLDEPIVVPNGRAAPFHHGEKAHFVLTAGRVWDEGKNVAALARIADELHWPVYVAGSTAAPQGRRVPLGPLQPLGVLAPAELAEWMSRAAIYALPARYEPFGLSVLEAALSGCALVLGDIPSLREFWDDSAVFVDPDDDELIASRIAWLCDDAPARRAIAARAWRRALELTPARMAAGYRAVYDRVRGAHRPDERRTACAS